MRAVIGNERLCSIGELARASGLTVRARRHYASRMPWTAEELIELVSYLDRARGR